MQSQSTTLLCRYGYDPLDRLTSHAIPDIPKCQRFYCKSRLATEIQGAIRYSIVQHGDQLLAQQQNGGDTPNSTLLVTDQQRSVLFSLKANRSRQPIVYSPYGHRLVENGLLSLLGYNGERPDPVTGHYLLGNGYRAFNPVLMRFNSPDSFSPFDRGGLNPYAYCLGDPINLRDPQGHIPIAPTFKTLASGYIESAMQKTIQKKISKIPRSLSSASIAERSQKILETTLRKNTILLDESAILAKIGRESGDIKRLSLPSDSSQSTARYFHHQKQGIPFNEFGIPNPKRPITTNEDGREILSTDFFDDAVGFFHYQASSKAPEPYRATMAESAGRALLARSKYIRKHALRNY